jgi:hypothetical protein
MTPLSYLEFGRPTEGSAFGHVLPKLIRLRGG